VSLTFNLMDFVFYFVWSCAACRFICKDELIWPSALMCETTGETVSTVMFILANTSQFLAHIMDFSEVWFWRTTLKIMRMNEP